MNDTIDSFDLDFAEYKFRLKNKGVVEDYIMRELSGLERDRYLTEISGRFDMDGKNTKVKNLVGVPEMLLSRCVYRIKEDGTEELVKANEIQTWPSSVREKLHEKATELSGLDKKADNDAKND